jgi:geranylgeranyl diphosphate synthase type I
VVDDDLVVLVDQEGRLIGTAPRLAVHTDDTPLHLAFSCYLFAADGRLLITRRALGKKTWPGVWTNSCCGHLKPGESAEAAVRRRVREELGLEIDGLRLVLPDFRYRAVDYSGIVEHELCPVFAGTLSGDPAPDPDEVMDHRFIEWDELVTAVAAAPGLISPWAAAQIPQLVGPFETLFPRSPATDAPQPTVAETLQAIRELLDEEADTLAAMWRRSIAPDDLDILDQDLPWWLRRLVLDGGKRLRPIMCHWGFVAAGGRAGGVEHDHVVRLGAALEILHTFALIHDDVMDASDTRRGRPSAHVHAAELHRRAEGDGGSAEFGINMAILLGDFAHIEADRLVSSLPAELRSHWYDLSVELIAGQRADLTGAAAHRRDLAHAQSIARLKSGGYTIQRPLLLGATAAGADAEAYEMLAAFGAALGEVFALRDDVLGVWGDPARTGKPAGDDLHHGKATVILSLAADALSAESRSGRADSEAAEALARVGTPRARAEDVPLLQQAFLDAGIRDRVEGMIRAGIDRATAVLRPGVLSDAGIRGLTEMAERVGWRDR